MNIEHLSSARSLSRRVLVSALSVLTLAGSTLGQWSTDPNLNLAIGDRIGDQNQAKVRAAPDGGCWITWYDNNSAGYDVYIQKLDAAGNEQLPHNGVLLLDSALGSTQDYDLRVDSAGNAVVVFRDDQISPGSVQVTLHKVAPDGTLLLGNSGLRVSGGTSANNPKCAVLSDGAIAVGWTESNTVLLQRVTVDNVVEFGSPIVISEVSRSHSLSDIQAAEDGSFIVLYVRCGGTNCVTSNKHLYSQKFDAGGSPQWDGDAINPNPNDPVRVFDGNSIQNGTFPVCFHDGSGGAVYGWYETGGSRRAYVQRIASNGIEIFPHNGVPVLTTAGVLSISAGFDFDPVTLDTYMAVKTTNANQNAWGIRITKIDGGGNRVWGDDGIEVIPTTGVQSNFERALVRPGGNGCEVYWFENAATPPGGRVFGQAYSASGGPGWLIGQVEVCSAFTGKARLDVARGSLGNAMLTWGDSRIDTRNIYAQSVLQDGSLGPPVAPCPADFNGDGEVNPDDLGDYINCYFSIPPCPDADVNDDGDVNPDDLGDYINIYFGPAC